jgi:K+/H+ antiporter YhaU regulatory subunit KhtT
MILGLERDGYATAMPDSNMLIEKGDILWIIGTGTSLSSIAAHSVGDAGTHSDSVTGDEFPEKGERK